MHQDTGLDHRWMWLKGADHQNFPTLEEYNCVTSNQSTGVWMMMTQSIIKPLRSDDSTVTTEKQWPFLGQSLNPAGLRQRVTTKLAVETWPEFMFYLATSHGTIISCVTSQDSWLAAPGQFLKSHDIMWLYVSYKQKKCWVIWNRLMLSNMPRSPVLLAQAEKMFAQFRKEWFSIKKLSVFSPFFSYFDTLC